MGVRAASKSLHLSGTLPIAVLFTGLILPQAILGLPIAAASIGVLPTLAIPGAWLRHVFLPGERVPSSPAGDWL